MTALSEHLERVELGAAVIVTAAGGPIARLVRRRRGGGDRRPHPAWPDHSPNASTPFAARAREGNSSVSDLVRPATTVILYFDTLGAESSSLSAEPRL